MVAKVRVEGEAKKEEAPAAAQVVPAVEEKKPEAAPAEKPAIKKPVKKNKKKNSDIKK